MNYFEQLYALAKAQNKEGLEQLLQTSQCCIDEYKKGSLLSAGELLAREKNKPATDLLQKLGANIDAIARGATFGGHKEWAEALRKEGANINAIARGAAMGRHKEWAEALRKERANINDIAVGAALGGDKEWVKALRKVKSEH